MSYQSITEMTTGHLVGSVEFPVLRTAEFRRIFITTHQFRRGVWQWDGSAFPHVVAAVFRTQGTLKATYKINEMLPESVASDVEVVVMQRDQDVRLEFQGDDAGCTIVWIPEKMIAPLGMRVSSPVVMEANTLATGAQSFVSAALKSRRQDGGHYNIVAAMESLLLGLYVCLVVQSSSLEKPISHTYAQFESARNILLSQLDNPRLTTELIAQKLNMSTRQLQRIFAKFGMTPGETIRTYRAELALSLMKDKKNSGATMAEIANMAGFGSPASLRRAIRALQESKTKDLAELHISNEESSPNNDENELFRDVKKERKTGLKNT